MKHIESPGSVLAGVGAVESCWLSNCQDVEADSTLGLFEEIKPSLSGRVFSEVTDSFEEELSGRNNEGAMIKAADHVVEPVVSRRLVILRISADNSLCLSFGRQEEVDY
jgi:hypothetical protein